MAKVKIAFVGNLPSNVNEDYLRKLFEPFGKLERVAISRKSNMPVGFVHFTKRSELDDAIKGLDGKTIEGPEKGPKFKIQVTVAKPAEKSKKRTREETQNTVSKKPAGQVKASVDVAAYSALNAKISGLAAKPFEVPAVADPYEVAVLSLPAAVTDRLLQIFRQGLATRYDIDIQCLASLRELPEFTAVAVLDQFAATSFADGRNKGAYLAGLISRYGIDNLGSARISMSHPGRSSELTSRDGGLLGITGTTNASLLDPLVASRPLASSALLRYDPYGTASSLGVPQIGLDDPHGLSSYRAPASTTVSLGPGLSTPEASGMERRSFKFDPFTGVPYKFDPFTGEPIQSGSVPSSRLTGKYY
eukprot:Gb_30624 [translate_table: standard]